MIHPLVVREDLVHCFKYWKEEIQEGMHFKGDLYTQFRSFSTTNRLDAYGLAYEQIEQDKTVCVTVSETRYVVWVCLRQNPAKASAPLGELPACRAEESIEQAEVVSGQMLEVIPGKREPMLAGLGRWADEHPWPSIMKRPVALPLSLEPNQARATA